MTTEMIFNNFMAKLRNHPLEDGDDDPIIPGSNKGNFKGRFLMIIFISGILWNFEPWVQIFKKHWVTRAIHAPDLFRNRGLFLKKLNMNLTLTLTHLLIFSTRFKIIKKATY